MGRRLVSITLDNVDELPDPCRSCAFWEAGTRLPEPGLKDDWISAVLLEWGSCGQLLYVDNEVAGFALYAPPEFAAMTGPVGGGTVSDDAVLLMTARILPEYAASGLGRVLVQSVVKDLMARRGVKAIEAFADAHGHEHTCVIPAHFLTAVGFKTIHPHPRYPRLRLDLRSVLTWRAEVEVALERLVGAIRPEKKRGPVGVAPRIDPPAPGPSANPADSPGLVPRVARFGAPSRQVWCPESPEGGPRQVPRSLTKFASVPSQLHRYRGKHQR